MIINIYLNHLGGMAVAVPGAFKGYATIYERFGGGVPWESLFEPTIKLCEEGIPISEHLEISLRDDGQVIRKDPLLRYSTYEMICSSVNVVCKTTLFQNINYFEFYFKYL